MKHKLHKFETNAIRETFEGSNSYDEPYVSLVEEDNSIHFNKPIKAIIEYLDNNDLNSKFANIYGVGELTRNEVLAFWNEYNVTFIDKVTFTENCTSIGDNAFDNSTFDYGINNIELSNTIVNIGDYAFYNNFDLNNSSITIPDSVIQIGDYAFHGCGSNVKNLHIGKNLSNIGDCAFSECYGISSITVDSQNTSYDSRNNCNTLIETATNTLIQGCSTTTIPNDIEYISNKAFCMVRFNNGQITLPDTIKTIGASAFTDSNISGITFGSGLTTINEAAFYYTSIKSVTLPDSLRTIGASAFCETSLSSVTFGNGVAIIGAAAFKNSNLPTAITLPNSVTSVGNYAFDGVNIKSITFGSGLTSLGKLVASSNANMTVRFYGMRCPTYDYPNGPFSIKSYGDIYAPTNSSGYDDLVMLLGMSWTLHNFTP